MSEVGPPRDQAGGFVVVVSGLPAAGKTTLSSRLGRDLGVPVVHRDRLRLFVFDGFDDPIQVAAATDRLVVAGIEMALDAGIGVVVDGNFNSERHMTPVRASVERRPVRTAEVCLWGDPDILRARFVDRATPPLTDDLRPYFERALHRSREAVLADPGFSTHVDTTDLDALDQAYDSILAGIREAVVT